MGVFGFPAVFSSDLMVLMYRGQLLRRLLHQEGIAFLARRLRVKVVFHKIIGRAGKHRRIPCRRVAWVDRNTNQRIRRGRLHQRIVAGGSRRRGCVGGRVVLQGMQVCLPAPVFLVAHRHVAHRDAVGERSSHPRGCFGWVARSCAILARAVICRQAPHPAQPE